MESLKLSVFIIVTLIIIAYAQQIYAIIKSRSSHGISFQAYVVTTIATLVLLYNADTKSVLFVALTELALVLLTTYLIIYYRSSDFLEKYTNGVFAFAIAGSFGMLHGITQTIKMFQEEHKSSVSSFAYIIWIFQDVLLISITNSVVIITAFVLNISMYSYIIWKNEKIKRRVLIS